MRTTTTLLRRSVVAGGTLFALLALAGCGRREDETVGQAVDRATEKAADKMDAAGNRIEQGADQAKQALSDTAITAAVKTKLTADDELKLLDISVETVEGRAVLSGFAPNETARERATRIAGTVDGVVAVDNKLTVKP